MNNRLTPEQWRALKAAPPAVLRAFLDRQCHDSFEMFVRQGWDMLNSGKPFPRAPYVRAMIHQLEALVTGEVRRLCNNIPPRHGKTEIGTVMLSAWILGRDPAAKVWVVSYGLELSEGFTAKIRQILKHTTYKRIFPRTRIKPGQDRAGHFHTTAGGECLAASQGSAVTGRGTHFMIIDDYQKADEALSPVERENAITSFRNTLLSRFDNLGDGRILINQQRLDRKSVV